MLKSILSFVANFKRVQYAELSSASWVAILFFLFAYQLDDCLLRTCPLHTVHTMFPHQLVPHWDLTVSGSIPCFKNSFWLAQVSAPMHQMLLMTRLFFFPNRTSLSEHLTRQFTSLQFCDGKIHVAMRNIDSNHPKPQFCFMDFNLIVPTLLYECQSNLVSVQLERHCVQLRTVVGRGGGRLIKSMGEPEKLPKKWAKSIDRSLESWEGSHLNMWTNTN